MKVGTGYVITNRYVHGVSVDERLVHWQYDQNTGAEVKEQFSTTVITKAVSLPCGAVRQLRKLTPRVGGQKVSYTPVMPTAIR